MVQENGEKMDVHFVKMNIFYVRNVSFEKNLPVSAGDPVSLELSIGIDSFSDISLPSSVLLQAWTFLVSWLLYEVGCAVAGVEFSKSKISLVLLVEGIGVRLDSRVWFVKVGTLEIRFS